MKKNLLRIIKLVLILIFLILLIKLMDFEKLKEVVTKAQVKYMIIGVLLTPLIVFLKSYKWHLLINKSKKIDYLEALKSYLAGYSMSVISPIRGGEFSRALFVKGCSLQVAFLVFIDKMMDITAICSYALIGLILFFPKYSLFLLIIILILLLLVYNPKIILEYVLRFAFHFKFFKKLVLEIKISKPLEMSYTFSSFILLLTFFAYFINFFQFYLFLLSFDNNASLKPVFFIIPFVSISKVIPLRIAGDSVGLVLAILLFSFYGISKEVVLGAVIIFNFVSKIIIAIIGMPIASKRFYT